MTDTVNRHRVAVVPVSPRTAAIWAERHACGFMFDRKGEITYPASVGDADYGHDGPRSKAGAKTLEKLDEGM